MTKNQVQQLLSAIAAADIKSYEFDSDTSTHLYHDGVNHLIKVDGEMIYGIRSSKVAGSHNTFSHAVQVCAMNCEDAHEFYTAGDYQQINTFLQNVGVNLTADEMEILVRIDKMNSNIIPANGDYNRFIPISDEEYERLTPEEKEEYDAKKAADEDHKKNYIGQSAPLGVHLSREW
jgi:hypothetical protein